MYKPKPRNAGATLPGWHCRLVLQGPPPCWVWKQWVAWCTVPGAGEQAGSYRAALAALQGQGRVEAGGWVHLWVVPEAEAAASETADPPAGSWWGRWWEPEAGSYQGPREKTTNTTIVLLWLLQAENNTQLLQTSQPAKQSAEPSGYRNNRGRQHRISLWLNKPIPLAAAAH